MNPIAEAALKRARRKTSVTSYGQVLANWEKQVAPAADQATSAPAPAQADAAPAPTVRAARVDQVMRIEGRRQALGMVDRAQGMLQTRTDLENLLAQLRRAAEGRPHSYTVGVLEIAEMVAEKLPAAPHLALDEFADTAPYARSTGSDASRPAAGRRAWP
ncbi:hypothetical protein PSGK_19065 [Pseudomonas solani]|uniref:hypothetical protein n=1 Tax=Pseudomonas solani TaxID=2731552 RepID=UPI0035BE72F5